MDGVKHNINTMVTNKAPDLRNLAVKGAFFDCQKNNDEETEFYFYKVIHSLEERDIAEKGEGVRVPRLPGDLDLNSYCVQLETLVDMCAKWKGEIDENFFRDHTKEIEDSFDLFFVLLITALEKAESAFKREDDDFRMYCKIIKGLLFMNSLGVRLEKQYLLPDNHPIVLMQQYTRWQTEENLKDLLQTGISEVESGIISQVIEVKNRNRLKFYMYSENKVYEVIEGSRGEHHRAVPFKEVRDNTPIPAVRIWEKVRNTAERLKKERKCGEHDKVLVNVAVFGELQKEELLYELCKLDNIDVRIDHYRKVYEEDGFLFEFYDTSGTDSMNRSENLIRSCDLLYSSDLERLFEQYALTLFLDLNCFYKQRQNAKDINEKNVLVNCHWYRERALQFKEFKDKAACYQQIYNAAGEWLNSYNSDMSSKYEFNERLYYSILDNIGDCADVYLYIKYGNKIGGKNLQNSNVCSDEYYDGKQLVVYKCISDKERDNHKAYYLFLEAKEEGKVKIDVWKILKSITNSYYENFIAACFGTGSNETYAKVIRRLKRTYCVLDYGSLLDHENSLSYSLQIDSELGQKAKGMLEDLMNTVLNYVFKERDILCVHNYLKHLIMQSIVSNANNVTDILFAYLLSRETFKGAEVIRKSNIGISKGGTCFDVRNTIQSVIENLASLRLRNTADKEGYFINDFRREVCPRVDSECFKAIMGKIHDSCSSFDYKNSQLYLNSGLNSNA